MKIFQNVVLLLLLVVLGVLAAQWLADGSARDFGEVFVRAGGYDYSTTVPGAILVALLLALALWLLWTLLALPFRAWAHHRRKQARARLIEGLDALQSGRWQRAGKLLALAAEDKEAAGVARAAAVRAAEASGDAEAARRHLDALAQAHPVLHAIVVAERALAHHDAPAALSSLDAPAVQPLPPRGTALRAEALASTGKAGEAYGLLGAIRQQQALSPTALAALEIRLAAQALDQAGDANALADHWEALPKPLRTEASVVAAYARRAAALRWDDAAVHSLEHAIEADWNEGLVSLYGSLPVARIDSRRASAQRWLQAHPASPALLIALARLTREQGQWPQARDFLHRALAQGAGAEAWEALGTGFAESGDDAQASRCYANALKAARGEQTAELPGRDMKQKIHDEAVTELRDSHGVPRLSP